MAEPYYILALCRLYRIFAIFDFPIFVNIQAIKLISILDCRKYAIYIPLIRLKFTIIIPLLN